MRGPLSIRARVTLAATAAVALVLLLAGVLTVTTFADRERSSLDRELQRRAEGPAGRIAGVAPAGRRSGIEGPPGGIGRPARGIGRPPPHMERQLPGGEGPPPGLLAESGTFVRIVEGGRVVQEAGDVPEGDFPLPNRAGFATVEAGGREWRTFTAQPPRASQLTGPGAPPRIQFAADLSPVNDRISEMRTRVAVILGLGVLIAAALAWLLADLALRPFSRLRAAVAGVSTTRDLSRRLPEEGAPEEVDELGRSVNSMLARLERSASRTDEALEATRRFAADVGHELRTPLTSIRANIDALRRNPSMPAEERRVILEEVLEGQDRLVALLDALQALARGDAGASLPREALDFADIVDAAVESARRRHPQASIGLDAPDEAQPVDGWPDGLRLLVDNLIENAVRHGGPTVNVRLDAADGGGWLVLSVDDDGPGVPEHERRRIFERFTRGQRAATSGTGLGLALAAQQAALHGGGVEVSESPLGGARFTVRLPTNSRTAGDTAPRRRSGS